MQASSLVYLQPHVGKHSLSFGLGLQIRSLPTEGKCSVDGRNNNVLDDGKSVCYYLLLYRALQAAFFLQWWSFCLLAS